MAKPKWGTPEYEKAAKAAEAKYQAMRKTPEGRRKLDEGLAKAWERDAKRAEERGDKVLADKIRKDANELREGKGEFATKDPRKMGPRTLSVKTKDRTPPTTYRKSRIFGRSTADLPDDQVTVDPDTGEILKKPGTPGEKKC